MKKILFKFLFLFFTLSVSAQKTGGQTSKDYNLKGKIKSVSLHTVTSDEIPDESNIKEKKYFDENGNLIREESFNKDIYSDYNEYQYGENDSIKHAQHI